jgi:hypothetical protein
MVAVLVAVLSRALFMLITGTEYVLVSNPNGPLVSVLVPLLTKLIIVVPVPFQHLGLAGSSI